MPASARSVGSRRIEHRCKEPNNVSGGAVAVVSDISLHRRESGRRMPLQPADDLRHRRAPSRRAHQSARMTAPNPEHLDIVGTQVLRKGLRADRRNELVPLGDDDQRWILDALELYEAATESG